MTESLLIAGLVIIAVGFLIACSACTCSGILGGSDYAKNIGEITVVAIGMVMCVLLTIVGVVLCVVSVARHG